MNTVEIKPHLNSVNIEEINIESNYYFIQPGIASEVYEEVKDG